MNDELVNRIDKTLHDIFMAMNLDRLPIQRENGSFSAKNLSLMEIRILRAINEQEGISLKDIRAAVDIPNSTLTSIIKKFEKKGLIKREIDQMDKRSYLLNITERGRIVNKEHRHFDIMIARTFIERVGNDELLERFVKETKSALSKPLFSMEEFCQYHDNHIDAYNADE